MLSNIRSQEKYEILVFQKNIYRNQLVKALDEVKKYIKRERRKTLPPKVDFWDFDCRFGVDEESCEVIHVSAINKFISEVESKQLESFYLEILAKPGHRSKKTRKSSK